MSQRCIRLRDLRVSSLGRRVPALGWSLGWSLSAALGLALALAVGLLWLLVSAPAGAQQITEDTKRPRIVGAPAINSPADGEAYRAGERIIVSLSFNEPVQVSGAPRLRLMIGERQRWARYSASSTDGESLSFAYEVRSGDRDEDGLTVKKNSLRLNGGAIVDGSGNAAKLKHKRLSGLPSHKVSGDGVTGEPGTVFMPTAPTAPGNVKADPIGDMEVKLSWDSQNIQCTSAGNQTAVKRHDLRLYNLTDDSVVLEITLRKGRSAYTVTELEASKTYEAEVYAVGCGGTLWSAPTYKEFTTTGMTAPGDPNKPDDEPKMPPNPPTSLTVTKQSDGSVVVSWTAATNNTGRCAHSYYDLYFGLRTETDPANEALIKSDITGLSTTVPKLPNDVALVSGTEYEVYVVSHSLECGSSSPASWGPQGNWLVYTHPTGD